MKKYILLLAILSFSGMAFGMDRTTGGLKIVSDSRKAKALKATNSHDKHRISLSFQPLKTVYPHRINPEERESNRQHWKQIAAQAQELNAQGDDSPIILLTHKLGEIPTADEQEEQQRLRLAVQNATINGQVGEETEALWRALDAQQLARQSPENQTNN